QSNLDKKDEVNKIITALSRFKKAAQTEFNRQIQPALDLEKEAKLLKGNIVIAIEQEWNSEENNNKRLDILNDKFGLEADTDGMAERFASDKKLWTPAGNPSSKIKDMIIDEQRREKEQQELKRAQDALEAMQHDELTTTDNVQPVVQEPAIAVSQDNWQEFVDRVTHLTNQYSVRLVVSPFEKKVIIESEAE
ncbi:hypothetical protein, partial [Weissella diestrammenae]